GGVRTAPSQPRTNSWKLTSHTSARLTPRMRAGIGSGTVANMRISSVGGHPPWRAAQPACFDSAIQARACADGGGMATKPGVSRTRFSQSSTAGRRVARKVEPAVVGDGGVAEKGDVGDAVLRPGKPALRA